MIGNDIVDLKQAAKDSNWKRSRFLDKVFTQKEQQVIFSAENQHQMVWLFWSMKEAAYKVNMQQFGKRFFNPKRIQCELFPKNKGQVVIDRNKYFTNSTITEDFIHSIATLGCKDEVKSEWFKSEKLDYKSQSSKVKKELITFLKTKFLKVRKNNIGIPRLFKKEKELNLSFSLTHHGYYYSYAIISK
ncbi:MAG: 4'-phosphopantetheinyl transferase superfamily protein [Lacinutrix sp.]|uniref:4'-phosphopantetheinyl transferase family protein n=1 Tax=Lacinutrix sp. TaxID=1937692 RepID=UPI0030B462C5